MASHSKQKKLKGNRQKMKLFRANEPIKSVLMWGINHSYSTLNHMKPRAMLLKDDFKANFKIKVNSHLFNKENMPSRFKFKEYCPLVFQNLRHRFGVDRNDYWDSFTRHQPLWDNVRGKSGSKFLVTFNRRYIAKTITSEEVEQMHHFIESYHEYVVNCHGQTLLPQYLGLYRLTVNDQEAYLLTMRNVFSPRITIHRKYDLKGSAVDREANEKEKSKPLPTLKDNDFVNDLGKISIGVQAKESLFQTLEKDFNFLQLCNLMDYSVLVGIHDADYKAEKTGDGDQENVPELSWDISASAGDGLGEYIEMAYRQGSAHATTDKGNFLVGSFGSAGGRDSAFGAQTRGMSIEDDEEEEEDEMGVSDGGGGSSPPQMDSEPDTAVATTMGSSGNLTPPDSPGGFAFVNQPFEGDLSTQTEFYGIKASPSIGRPVIYFVAIIDILTRYGMRKRTAQTYKTVKHGAGSEISTVKPDVYGVRLFEFMKQCVE